MSSYEDRMSEKYGFFSDKKKNTETGSEKNTESSVESTDELQATEGDNLIVPLEA